MDRDAAVQIINEGLGFRAEGTLDSVIVKRLQQAQFDLEHGKTLPKFLLEIDQSLVLAEGESTAEGPAGFLRESDETRLRYLPEGEGVPVFLSRRLYIDAVQANVREDEEPRAPRVYVIRRSSATLVTIDFITTADTEYELFWDYYKADDVLTSNIENKWLVNASDWLIGEAGLRVARATRNASGVELFTEMRQTGRAATFGELIAEEEASGPFVMGANL